MGKGDGMAGMAEGRGGMENCKVVLPAELAGKHWLASRQAGRQGF